ncbi:MAG: DUF1269 domain-containing protein [Chloroflexota bacterium]
MSDLVVITYNQESKATDALAKIATLKQENVQKALVHIEDAAVAVKNAKGKVKIKQTLESAVKGGRVASGGLWGLLIGFLFGGPIFGALLGMGLYALLGNKIDIGIDNKFIDDVSNDLAPGDSALFLLVNNTPAEVVSESLSEFGGNLYHTSLSDEAEQAFHKALEQEEIKTAVIAHHEA